MTRRPSHTYAGRFAAVSGTQSAWLSGRRWAAWCAALVGLWTNAALAQNIGPATPMPAFSGQPLTVVGVPNTFGDLPGALRKLDEGSPQSYYVVVIKSAGPGEWATVDYADELVPRWIEQSAQRGPEFDPDRSVVMVLAMQNRRLAVKPGRLLQTKYGLQGDRLDRDFVQPYFLPGAKVQDFGLGLKTLATELDRFVAGRDEAAKRAAELAAAGREKMARDADELLQAFPPLAAEVERDATAVQALGAPAGRFTAALTRARALFQEAQAKRSDDPQAAYRAAQSAQAALQQIQSDVNRWSLNQAEALQRVARAEPRLSALDESLLAQARRGLAVDPLRKLVDEAQARLDAAQQAAKSDPTEAVRIVGDVERQLSQGEALLKALPQQHQELLALQAEAKAAATTFEKQLAEAISQGLNAAEAQRMGDALRSTLSEAAKAATQDYTRAAPLYRSALQNAQSGEAALVREAKDRAFWFRDLPLTLFGLVALLVGAVFLWRWRRHVSQKRAAGEQFAAFKARVVALSDSIDQLRERHRLLPASDPDFTSPIQGETLKVYNAVQGELDRLRDRWLELMDVWEKSQKLIALDGPFGDAHLQKALDSLAAAGGLQTESDLAKQRVVEPLDRLNRAHEDAAGDLQKLADALAATPPLVKKLTETGRATNAYAHDLALLTEALDAARPLLTADPLGVVKTVAELESSLAEQKRRLEDAARLAIEANQLIAEAESIAEDVAEQRTAGETLNEDGANPDAWLAEARGKHQTLIEMLDRADTAGATSQLEAGRAALARARGAVKDYAEAKEFVGNELPAAGRRREQLESLLQTANEHRAALEKEFLPSLWREADDMLGQGRAKLETVAARLAEAAQAADRKSPRYLLARRTLEALQATFHETQTLLAGVGVLLARLRQLRSACQERAETLRTARTNVERYFAQHDAIVRSGARTALAQAVQADDEARRQTAQPRPDWTQIAPAWAAVETLLGQAQDLADSDVAQHAEAHKLTAALQTYAAKVGRTLEANTADRPRANQRFQTARRLIDAASARLQDRQGDWRRLLDELNEAQEGLAKAEQWAQEDVRLAQQATAEIDEAESAARRVQSFYRLGVRADASSVGRLLDEARKARANQDYERAVQLANEAEQVARQAENAALRAAEERERQQERERQLRQAAAAAAVLANAGSMRDALGGSFSHHRGSLSGGGMSSGGARSSSGSSRSSSSSGTSDTRIPTGTSQTGW